MSFKLLYIVAFASLLVPMTNTIYNPNIPAIQRDMNTSTQLIALTISVFTAMMALSQLIYGPISDRHGRRAVLVFGLIVYMVSNAAIFFSTNIYQLIFLRAVQAFGVSSAIVVGAAALADVYKKDLGNVLGTYQSVILAGPLIGPVAGGVIASFFGWRSIFLALLALGMIAFTLVYFFLEETLKKSHAFSHPLSSLKLLKDAKMFLVSFLGFASLAASFTFVTFLPIILNSHGIGPALIGFAFLPSGIALFIGSRISGKIVNREGPKKVIMLGGTIFVLSTAAFAFFVGIDNIYYALAALTVSSIGAGMFWPAARIYAMGRSHMKASANGAFNFMSFLGATMAPSAGSILVESFGLFVMFASFAALMLVALLAVAWKA